MILLLAALARAADGCVDLTERLTSAEFAFTDAEVAEAARLLDLARAELTCQSEPITEDELFRLYVLDATASLATGDAAGAESAAIQGVTAAPERQVDAQYGPEVRALFDTWRARLQRASVHLTVDGDTPLVLDGRTIAPGGRATAVAGSHLLQWATPDGLHTQLSELTTDYLVRTGARPANPGAALTPAPPAADEPPVARVPEGGAVASGPPAGGEITPSAPSSDPSTPAPSPPPPRRRVGSPGVWGAGIAIAALGGGLVVTGWQLQERFERDPYDGSFEGLSQADAGYADARQRAIEQDALAIRVVQGGGYGMLGLGTVLFGVGLGVQAGPQRASIAVTIPLR
jgi:hypothetical protein